MLPPHATSLLQLHRNWRGPRRSTTKAGSCSCSGCCWTHSRETRTYQSSATRAWGGPAAELQLKVVPPRLVRRLRVPGALPPPPE